MKDMGGVHIDFQTADTLSRVFFGMRAKEWKIAALRIPHVGTVIILMIDLGFFVNAQDFFLQGSKLFGFHILFPNIPWLLNFFQNHVFLKPYFCIVSPSFFPLLCVYVCY